MAVRRLAGMTPNDGSNNRAGCIFCRIVAGKSPSTTIAETERAIAFMDINPVTPGHALVVPRAHADDLFDISVEDLAACAELAQEIARRAKVRLGADGINLLNSNGKVAKQSVFHFHIHVIPRYSKDPRKDTSGMPWQNAPASRGDIRQIGQLLT